MTVAELIEKLKDLPPDAQVLIWDDHWAETDWVPLMVHEIELERDVEGKATKVRIG